MTIASNAPGRGASERGDEKFESVVASESDSLGRYKLLRKIGEGGMGVVYLGYDEVLDRNVAIKLVRPERADLRAPSRVLREGRALARLSHQNVVRVFEVSASHGRLYLVMEYVKGGTLREYCRGAREPREILNRFLEAGRGLAAAHAQGLVHRDFKPDNVLIGEDGSARVVDFGLVAAQQASPDGGSRATLPPPGDDSLTKTGAFLGTPAYMSPEQFRGEKADARSDQFSFCVALHEGLTGIRPFSDQTVLEHGVAGARDPEPNAEQLADWIAAAVRRGLAPSPEDRWPSMDALLEVLARDPSTARRRQLRQLGLLALVSLVIGGLVLGGVVINRSLATAARERRLAARLNGVEARILAARERNDHGAAARAFEEFIVDPGVRDSHAYVRAWISEGGRQHDDGRLDRAGEAFANAYMSSLTKRERVDALTGVAATLRSQQRWGALRQALATLARVDPDAIARAPWRDYATEAALGQRDVTGAIELMAREGRGPSLRLLERLATTARETTLGNVHKAHRIDFEGDGVDELLLLRSGREGLQLAVVRRDPSLTEVTRYSLDDMEPGEQPDPQIIVPFTRDSDGRQLLLGTTGPDRGAHAQILRLGDRRLERQQSLELWFTASRTSGDLDGDGEDEVYLGTGPFSRRILQVVQEPDGEFGVRAPIAASDAPNSNVYNLLIEDLDGDGRRELVAATGPWESFDIRVYRHERGSLRLVDRDMLGCVNLATTVRVGQETLLLAAHGTNYPSRRMFPPGRVTGEELGVYLYRLKSDRLERVQSLPLEAPPAAQVVFSFVGSGDINGDGLEDIGVSYWRERARGTVLYLQRDDGSFTPLHMAATNLVAMEQLDDDGVIDLALVLGQTRSRGDLWIIGTGASGIPEAETAPRSQSVEPLVDAPSFATAWSRARDLQGMGLHTAAARAFERIAKDASEPALAAQAAFAAASSFERVSDYRRASRLYVDAAQDDGFVARAARNAYRAFVRLGEFDSARDALDRLLRVPDLEDRESLVTERARLDDLVRGHGRLELTFDQPLAGAWRIHDPLALRHDAAAGALVIDTTTTGTLASYPVELASGGAALEIELTFERQEWESNFRVALVPEGEGDRVLEIEFDSGGGAGVVRRQRRCYFDGDMRLNVDIAPDSMARERVSIRASRLLPLAEHRCTTEDEHGETKALSADVPPAAVAPGRYRLILRHVPEQPARLQLRVHRISVVGASPAPRGASAPLDQFARALVERDYARANELVAALDPAEPRARMWVMDTRLRAGDIARAREELASLLDAGIEDPTIKAGFQNLLRSAPELYGPLLWSDSPSTLLDWYYDASRIAVDHHIDDRRVIDELIAVLGRVEPGHRYPGEDLRRAITLTRWRAMAYARTGQLRAARRDLEAALAMTREAMVELGDEPRRETLLELAALAVTEHDARAAERFVEEAIATSVNRTLTRDLIRARPELAGFL